jgi:YidC/Oxa1 family membrane protein insertase
LQPELKAIQAKYKEDKQRQQQELMKFYRENQVNPLASCLPLAAQLPVFISLFYMLRQSLRNDICHPIQIAARAARHLAPGQTVPCGPHAGAGFLFINDLTDKATGAVLVVLIVLYVGTQLASSRMMASPTMDQTQQRIMMLMPLFFVIFIIRFPAGVIVYWITTNSWTMGQQYVIRRRLGPPPAAVASSGSPAGTAEVRSGGGLRAALAGNTGAGAEAGGGGLASLWRNRPGAASAAGVESGGGAESSRGRGAPPPPPPRKKKKRSGRRR